MVNTIKNKGNPSGEFEAFVEKLERTPSPSSIKGYQTQYNKIYGGIGKNISEATVEELTAFIDTIESKNTKKNLLNIMVMVKKQSNKAEADILYDLREALRDDIMVKVQEKNEVLEKTLPSYEDMLTYISGLTGKAFIVNYLFLNYYVRNKDVDVQITTDKNTDTTKGNWLVVTGVNSVEYIRNDYKTVKAHGSQTHHIKNKKFYQTVKTFMGDDTVKRLFDGKQISKEVKDLTYKELTETQFLKVLVYHFTEQLDVHTLLQIEKLRGTNMNLLLRNYNIRFQVPTFTEETEDD